MAKKSKKDKKDKEKESSKAGISPLQIVVAGIIIAALYLGLHPELLTPLSEKIPAIASLQSASETKSLNPVIEGVYSKAQQYFLDFARKTKIPAKYTGLPEDMVVEDVVSSFSQEVKDLPSHQVKRIKTQFCQDVINDATATISAGGN